MKKSKMLIAVLAVSMAAASAAKAEGVGVDFDGRTSGAEGFTEALNNNTLMSLPEPIMDPQFSNSRFNFQSPGCAVVCQYGINNDCSCKDPWRDIWDRTAGGSGFKCEEIGPDSWYSAAKCTPDASAPVVMHEQAKSKGVDPAADPALQKELREILLGYCEKYPEFADAALPMLKDEKARIVLRNGFGYIVSGNSIIRFGGEEVGGSNKKGPSRRGSLDAWGAAASALDAVNDAYNAWREYHSYPPVPDSGEANHYHGPALTVDPNDADLHSYPAGKEAE